MPAPTKRYDAFLFHNHADQSTVAEIARQLADAGMHPWFAASPLLPGTEVQAHGKPWEIVFSQQLLRSAHLAQVIEPRRASRRLLS